MSTPCDEQLLSRFLDDELSPLQRSDVEAHLAGCPACAGHVGFLRETSGMLRAYPFEDLTEPELGRLHRAVSEQVADDGGDEKVWRIGGTLGLIAASVLVVGVAWLKQLPSAPSGQQAGTAIASAPRAPLQPWERAAVTLRPDPSWYLVDQPGGVQLDDVRLAEANVQLADWMIAGLAEK